MWLPSSRSFHGPRWLVEVPLPLLTGQKDDSSGVGVKKADFPEESGIFSKLSKTFQWWVPLIAYGLPQATRRHTGTHTHTHTHLIYINSHTHPPETDIHTHTHTHTHTYTRLVTLPPQGWFYMQERKNSARRQRPSSVWSTACAQKLAPGKQACPQMA